MEIREFTTDGKAAAYAPMTFPKFRPYCLGEIADPKVSILVAQVAGQPAGMLLALQHPATRELEILSLYTRKDHRRKGVAAALLDHLETHASASSVDHLITSFNAREGESPGIAALLARKSWTAPRLKMMLFELTVEAVLTASWVQQVTEAGEGFEVMPWSTVSPAEAQALIGKPWVPAELQPTAHVPTGVDGAPVLPRMSFVMRHQDEICGWHFSHHLTDKTVRYSVSYIRPDLQTDMGLLHLWYHAAVTSKEFRYEVIKLGVAVHHEKMLSFCQSFLGPLASDVTRSMGARKRLGFGEVWV